MLKSIDWEALSVGVLVSECHGIGCASGQDTAVREHLARAAPELRHDGVLRARHDVWDAVYVNATWAALEGITL